MTKISKKTAKILIDYYHADNLIKLEAEIKILIKKFPNEIFLHNIFGMVFVKQKKYKKALAAFDSALMIQPNNSEILCNIGNVYYAQGNIDQSVKEYKKAIKINPDYAQAYYNIGNANKDKFNFKNAIFYYEKSIEIKPDYAEAYCNLGNIKKYQGNFNEAIINYHKALKINANYGAAFINLSYLYLSMENFKDGWRGHEERDEIKIIFKNLNLDKKKLWNGEKFSGNLMVVGEQGLGDYVLFGSMLNDLTKIHDDITVMMNERMLSIFIRSFPKINFINFNKSIERKNYKKYIFFGSLGKHLRNSAKEFPKKQISFLFPDKNKINKIKESLKNNSRKNIGLSWKTSSLNNKNERSIDLINFGPLFQNKNYNFINLQYGETGEERSLIKKKFDIELLHFKDIDYTNDIEKLAALISNCDLIITIANFTAQFSGSIGTPTWVLLPYSCHWRWFLNRTDSPWYPSVKLFRQKKWADWSSVIKKINLEINNLKK